MRRGAAATERLVVLLVGLVLLALGAAAVAWERGWIPDAVDRVDATALLDRTGESWWPWVEGLVGLLLVLVAVAWLLAHTRRSVMTRLPLSGSGRTGKLDVDSGALVSAASGVLDNAPGVRARGGRVLREPRELVVELRAAIDPGADLDETAEAAERASAALRSCLGSQSGARCRVILVRSRPWAKRTRVR
ncbi:hypothetical protein [Jiangella asiatica]|uniref:Alkaline shock response membrane anchor protein AmaP n=1 Tax=Jiangella asiatica TaxID=2530372 RepID=A0A4R5D7X2_9ACTN|nr:hypothetical protein [Jiangella asiatica]TDE09629.1 hypothetical protein E1269_13395 [Jiangella asiatica]